MKACARALAPGLSLEIEQPRAVTNEAINRKRLGEQVRGVELRVDVLHVKLPLGSQLTHLKVTTVDVARPVARLAVAGELHGTRVVDVDEGDSSIL